MNKTVLGVAVMTLLASAGEVSAQPYTAISRFVVDARGSLARFKQDVAVADTIGVDITNLPTRGLGVTAGAHFYPLRARRITIGIGGEVLFARDSRTIEATDTTEAGPEVVTRLAAISPQLSLNCGRGDGWSYLSGGPGWGRITSARADEQSTETAARTRSINYGGGARWFTGPRMAFTFDLRFYAISPRIATGALPGYPRTRTMVISAGVSFR